MTDPGAGSAPPALFAAVMLTGCGGSPAVSPAATSIPAPNPTQRAALMEELGKVDVELAHPRAVSAARMACKKIQEGASDDEQKIVVAGAFRMGNEKFVSPEQAGRVLAVIKANGFCTTSSDDRASS
ncbi:hypothetical protein [Arthrobacter sp. ISL-65]|uniref:hypothetical protein n=1 Tax=Arthrobacter sp. ISL-65 TaxID=2819112 RepID=UPI001BEA0728|nr:hypothetical protein [Arthrobacter sp. ISL-65]MBT2549737.1 hypothetical protein [Arthrobacter sp. ISL-65]